LVKLGVEFHKVQSWAYSRKIYSRCANSFLQVAIPNIALKKRGLVLLLDQYQLIHIRWCERTIIEIIIISYLIIFIYTNESNHYHLDLLR